MPGGPTCQEPPQGHRPKEEIRKQWGGQEPKLKDLAVLEIFPSSTRPTKVGMKKGRVEYGNVP